MATDSNVPKTIISSDLVFGWHCPSTGYRVMDHRLIDRLNNGRACIEFYAAGYRIFFWVHRDFATFYVYGRVDGECSESWIEFQIFPETDVIGLFLAHLDGRIEDRGDSQHVSSLVWPPPWA